MSHPTKICELSHVLIFVTALIGGTLCSLSSKILLSMKGEGMTGEMENFSYPLFQTFGMFLGMAAALGLHYAVLKFKIPFPGYNHEVENPKPTPVWVYFLLSVPSIFDLAATVLAMFGLISINVSIYQMLRGSAIIFVALVKQFVLGHHLQKYKWIGICFNVLSIVLVGLTAMLIQNESGQVEDSNPNRQSPMVGMILILAGAFVQSLQYVFEEKVMTEVEGDIPPTPPLLLIGMEGLWGSVICLFILYPLAYAIHGPDHGCFENPYNTIYMITNSPRIQAVFVLYFFSVLQYNILAVLVTLMLDSVWHAILDNFRPITVWMTDMAIFYFISKDFGESWSSHWSWLQVIGMIVLLYGTAVYNAPNPGSIKLVGNATSLFLDCSSEYPSVNPETETEAILSKDTNGQTTFDSRNVPFNESITPAVLLSPAFNSRDRQRNRKDQLAVDNYELEALKGKNTVNYNNKNYGGTV